MGDGSPGGVKYRAPYGANNEKNGDQPSGASLLKAVPAPPQLFSFRLLHQPDIDLFIYSFVVCLFIFYLLIDSPSGCCTSLTESVQGSCAFKVLA